MNNHNKSNLIIISVIALLSIACSKESESQLYIGSTAVDTTTVLSGIDTPWELLYGPDGYLWFTERSGKVSRFSPLTGESTIILTIQDVLEYGEAGLLGMALHPEFDAYPWVYLVYNYSSGEFIKERLVRYVWNGSALTDGIILINNIRFHVKLPEPELSGGKDSENQSRRQHTRRQSRGRKLYLGLRITQHTGAGLFARRVAVWVGTRPE